MIVRNNDEIGEKMILCEIGIVLPKQYENGKKQNCYFIKSEGFLQNKTEKEKSKQAWS